MKTFARFLTVIFLAALVAAGLQYAVGIDPAVTFMGLLAISVVLSILPKPAGIAMAGLFPELWTGELIKKFRHDNSFLGRIGRKDNLVLNNIINLADIGVDPLVLVNNTTYPIAGAQREDTPIAITLDKFDTENTIITDDELQGLPYDKPGSVIEQHREVLEEKTAEKSLHSLCPQADGSETPVVFTTGASDAGTYARKRAQVSDIIKLKRKLDDLKIPQMGRELVLCPQHVEDLLLTNQLFKEAWYDRKTGQLFDMFGFTISEFMAGPSYSYATQAKKAFGAAAAAADDLQVSVCYYSKRAVQARGAVKMYHKKAETDPQNRQSEIGFRLYHICLPKKSTGFGALVSTKV
ncbi:MAG: hypothetical protein Q8O72_10595 [Bacteroidales bacterium]|nr:hypothetical protein [Bacteroidales bacterium]